VVHVHLDGRVADDQVTTDDVTLDPGSHIETVCVAGDGVVLDDIVVSASALNADAKVVALGCIAISTEPVPTEPVAAGAAEHSYAAAGGKGISVAHRNIAADLMAGPAADEDAGETIGRERDAGYGDASALV
jgi:hypothetical protein